MILGCLILLMGLVIYVVLEDPSEDGNSGDVAAPTAGTLVSDDFPSGGAESAGERSFEPVVRDRDQPMLLSRRRVSAIVSQALVVLAVDDSDGRPLREVRGVLLTRDGIVLCRFTPLLGAHSGTARLFAGDSSMDVRGLCYRHETYDLALVKLDVSDNDLSWVSIVEGDPTELFTTGDSLYIFSDHRGASAPLESTRIVGPDGVGRMALDPEVPLAANSLFALDPYGQLVGLCRAEKEGELVREDRPRPTDDFRFLVDTVDHLEPFLDAPVVMTLRDATQQFYEGTFEDLYRRGAIAYRQSRWAEAIGFLDAALGRQTMDTPTEEEWRDAKTLLREAYFQEARRLSESGRWQNTTELMEASLVRYENDAIFWRILGEARVAHGQTDAGIGALLESLTLQPSADVEEIIELTYLSLASDAVESGDDRQAELVLQDGVEQLPGSSRLHLELARVYLRFEAFDDATRLLVRAQALDPSSRPIVESLLAQIDEALRRRDALIIPITSGRSIRTNALIDGRESTFIVDTGATYTAISTSLAEELGYDLRRANRINVRTANGVISAPLIQVRSLDLAGYVVRNPHVLVLPPGVGPDLGLLGLNYLNHFKYTVDAQRSEFRLQRP